jgi:aspartate/methionine/tyrosine aminotransferase
VAKIFSHKFGNR